MTMDVRIGQIIAAKEPLKLSKERIAAFAETSGDASIVHLDDQAARDFGFPQALAHGLLGMTLAGRLFTDRYAPHQLRQISARFTAMTFVDEELRCEAEVTGLRSDGGIRHAEFSIKAINQKDEVVMTGSALLSLD